MVFKSELKKQEKMEKKKKPLSIRIIYWLTQITFWLFVLVFIGAIVLNVGLQAEWFGDDMQLHVGLPVEVNYTESGMLYLNNMYQEVEFVEAIGRLHLIDTNRQLAKWFGGAVLGVVIVFLFIFILFKNFIGNVYRGIIFERYNIRMLKKIAYGLAGLWLFTIMYNQLFYHLVAKQIEFEHLEISGDISLYGGILLAALFLWVLSHIFMTGVKLREEQELTV